MSSPASSALGFLVRAMVRCEDVLKVWALAGASVSGAAQFSSGGWSWRWKRYGALFLAARGPLASCDSASASRAPQKTRYCGACLPRNAPRGRRAHSLWQPLHALCSTKSSLNRRRRSLNRPQCSPRGALVQRPRPCFAAAHSQCSTTITAGTAGHCLLLRSHASVSF